MDLSPKYKSEKFECPHCEIASQQTWFDDFSASTAANQIISDVFYNYRHLVQSFQQETIANFVQHVEAENKRQMRIFVPSGFSVATCSTCNKITLWVNKEIVYPKKTPVAQPNEDMSEEIKDLYREAAAIVTDSPKGAAAILRLALELLLKQLGKKGKDINSDIKELVAEGLSPKIQKALDLLRVVGNHAVHPGKIDLEDGRDIALKLFHVLNFIANELISKPKELELLYEEVVPEEAKDHIKKRDGKN